jgi:hypothetical protein
MRARGVDGCVDGCVDGSKTADSEMLQGALCCRVMLTSSVHASADSDADFSLVFRLSSCVSVMWTPSEFACTDADTALSLTFLFSFCGDSINARTRDVCNSNVGRSACCSVRPVTLTSVALAHSTTMSLHTRSKRALRSPVTLFSSEPVVCECMYVYSCKRCAFACHALKQQHWQCAYMYTHRKV